MRLDFRNIGKGLEAIAGAKQARDLAQESARYDVTQGAYGPGLQENIQQLEGLRANVADPAQNSYDPQQLAAYDQSIAELTRRQGLTAPDYSVASGPTNFATRQEARQAAAPMRAEGLAGVYRQYGDVAQADALEARAFEQQRGLAAEERAKTAEADRVARRPLEIKQLENALVSQGLTIDEARQVAIERKGILDAREELQAIRKVRPLTAADISSVAGKFRLDPTKFAQAEDAVNTLEIKDLKRNLSSAALKGEDGLNAFLADKFDPDKTDNIKPMITKAKDGSFVVTYGDRVLSEYGSHKNMMSLVGGVINMIDNNPFDTLKTLSTLETQAAARDASKATASLTRAREKMVGDAAKRDELLNQYEELSDADKVGSKGRGLAAQINALGGKAMGLGASPRQSSGLTPIQDTILKELVKTDEWQRAKTTAEKATVLRKNGIPPDAAGFGGRPNIYVDGTAAGGAAEPTQPFFAIPTRPTGLATPAQIAAAQQTQKMQNTAQSQQSTAEGIRTSGVARENFMLQQEAASLTPAVIRQLTPSKAAEASLKYGQFLTPEQRKEINRRQ